MIVHTVERTVENGPNVPVGLGRDGEPRNAGSLDGACKFVDHVDAKRFAKWCRSVGMPPPTADYAFDGGWLIVERHMDERGEMRHMRCDVCRRFLNDGRMA